MRLYCDSPNGDRSTRTRLSRMFSNTLPTNDYHHTKPCVRVNDDMNDETQIIGMEDDTARDAEEIKLLKGRVSEPETVLLRESVRVDRLLAGRYNHKTRESIDIKLFACGDCDPCLGGRPDQCAVMSPTMQCGRVGKMRQAFDLILVVFLACTVVWLSLYGLSVLLSDDDDITGHE